jgi:hypothetical protein
MLVRFASDTCNGSRKIVFNSLENSVLLIALTSALSVMLSLFNGLVSYSTSFLEMALAKRTNITFPM